MQAHGLASVADSPHPVWVGIGHEIDFGVLDQIAHTSHKTPTAVAESLVRQVRELNTRIGIAADRLVQATDRMLQLAFRRAGEFDNGLRQGTRKHLAIQSERFRQRASQLQSAVAQISERTARRQQFAQAQLAERTRRIEEDAQQRLQESAEAIRQRTEWLVAQAGQTLARALQGLLNGSRKHLDHFVQRALRSRLRLSLGIDRHANRIGQSQAIKAIRIEALGQRLIDSAVQLQRSRSQRIRLGTYESRLSAATRELEQRQKRLEAMSPERLLAKGYSITRTTEGELVRSVANLEAGARIVTQLQDGSVTSVVEDPDGRQ